MTDEGLQEVRTALSHTATRQTAVACYQNDGRRRMILLWIVGSRHPFGPGGHFPAGRRKLKAPVLSDWERHAGLLARLAGLLHDLGKYSVKFQDKLRGKVQQADAVRHEWISLKLWQAIRAGKKWEDAWEQVYRNRLKLVLGERELKNNAHGLTSAAECLDALLAMHHGLFSEGPSPVGRLVRKESVYLAEDTLFQPADTPTKNYWQQVHRLEKRLNICTNKQSGENWISYWRMLFWMVRAALIFADHSVSSRKFFTIPKQKNHAFANTCTSKERERSLNQPLADHLKQVSELAGDTVWRMTRLAKQPDQFLEGLQPCAVESVIKPTNDPHFQWQNKAADALTRAREEHPNSSMLVFNMARTGSGKTRMNVRAACVLSRLVAPRLSIALNLRSLTMQTGYALQQQLGLSDNDLAVIIGDEVTRQLFFVALNEQSQLDDDDNLDAWQEPETQTAGGTWSLPAWLGEFFPTSREKRILGAPLLVSTIDYLIAAGEPQRQGHHVKALLRLMSADLILDEVDAYEPEALAAVLRLVQWSAFFGRNVICSTATLSRPVALAVYAAYTSGAELALRLKQNKLNFRQEKMSALYLITFIDDIIDPQIHKIQLINNNQQKRDADFLEQYNNRINNYQEYIRKQPIYRSAFLIKLKEQNTTSWRNAVLDGVNLLHSQHYLCDVKTGIRYSFGLVRVANIPTAVKLARYLAERLPQALVACYHANDWRIVRFYKEQRLDFLLSRKPSNVDSTGDTHILADTKIRKIFNDARKKCYTDVPFIVVATPVEEVGRDHDFDWAVIDVSSAQSLVQTAGRVNRHRLKPCAKPNIAIPQYNWRHCHNAEQGKEKNPAFIWPGYEKAGGKYAYSKHDLQKILPWDSDRLIITAELRLNTERCSLARRDDKAIMERLFPYFAPDQSLIQTLGEKIIIDLTSYNLFVSLNCSASLLTNNIYDKTSLRNRNAKAEQWRLKFDEDSQRNIYQIFEYQGQKRGMIGQWLERDTRIFREVKAMPNAWLYLTPEEMRSKCLNLNINIENALAAELNIYYANPTWEYDNGFGILRRNLNDKESPYG